MLYRRFLERASARNDIGIGEQNPVAHAENDIEAPEAAVGIDQQDLLTEGAESNRNPGTEGCLAGSAFARYN